MECSAMENNPMLRWTMPYNLSVFIVTITLCLIVLLIYTSASREDPGLVTIKLAETETRVGRLTELYELENKNVQKLIETFSSDLKEIINLLNISISKDVRPSSMSHFDLHTFLPHLRFHKEDYLTPIIFHSAGRATVSVVYGVPTVFRRQQNYLIQTLINLVSNMDKNEQKDALIVVMIAEIDRDHVQRIVEEIENRLPDALNSGLIDIIAPFPRYYPDFSKLRITFNDSEKRVRWRSKQNLDYVFLMTYCQPKGLFYVQLEDDIIAKPQFHATIKKTTLQKIADGKHWFILNFCSLGFIGKLMKSSDLPWMIQFIAMFYNDKPGDWLLEEFLKTKICHLEKDFKDCQKRKSEIFLNIKPSLFQHIGIKSSLDGKIQLLKDMNSFKVEDNTDTPVL